MANIIGKTLLNQFRVDEFVAAGGMGAVYRVWDMKRNVPLAMKVLHSDLADDPHVFKRFKREANALKKLTHPHIVQFYGLFKTPEFAFLLEAFIDGPSLKDILRRYARKPMPIHEALTYLNALCSTLGYAHANGVIHCDVKPGNIIVDRGGTIYLTDFGIARHAESTTTTLASAGTASYMAPEQIRGEPVMPATDVYALGVMLFEMLTGRRPFQGSEAGTEKGGDTANERIRYAHLHLQPPNPKSHNPSLSRALALAILSALDKNQAERYQTMQAFFEAVCSASGLTSAQISDRVILPEKLQKATSPNPILSPKISPPIPLTTSRGTRISWLIGGIALVVMIVAIGSMGGGVRPGSYGITPFASNPIISSPSSPTRLVAASPTLIMVTSPTASSIPEITCPGAPHPSRFEVDQPIYVCTKKETLALRARPAGNILLRLLPGSDLTVSGGPRCEDNVFWWKVRTESGKTGWVMDGSDERDKFFICPEP
jgi:serine/threonine protein kinase